MRLAVNENDAWDLIDGLALCENCENLSANDLFGGFCRLLKREVDFDQRCEGFHARDKKVEYWINKLVEMAMEFGGDNDIHRKYDYHEKNGSLDKFLHGE